MLRFDTRKKKPKVYNVAILSAVTAAVLAFLLTRDPIRMVAVGVALGVYLGLTIIFLLTAFVKQIQYNPYSYNTIYYIGFSLFLLSVLISVILVVAQFDDTVYTDMAGIVTIFHTLLGSAKTFMILSIPFMTVFSVALCVSNISLIRHEGKRLVNVLGIFLAICLLGGEAVLLFGDYYVSGSLKEIIIHEMLINLFAAFYLYFECMLIGTIIADIIVVRYEPDKDKDYLIILGCKNQRDGRPTPLLAGRVDRALEFRKAQIESTGKIPVMIPSGGKGADEPVPESESMKNYMLEKGVPEDQILMEDNSRNTYENMLFSKKLIEERDPDAKMAFFTTNYHVFRSGLLARRVKMRAVGAGAKTKWYFWPNAAVREFVGILTEHRLKQGLILGGMIAIYMVSTLLLYLLL